MLYSPEAERPSQLCNAYCQMECTRSGRPARDLWVILSNLASTTVEALQFEYQIVELRKGVMPLDATLLPTDFYHLKLKPGSNGNLLSFTPIVTYLFPPTATALNAEKAATTSADASPSTSAPSSPATKKRKQAAPLALQTTDPESQWRLQAIQRDQACTLTGEDSLTHLDAAHVIPNAWAESTLFDSHLPAAVTSQIVQLSNGLGDIQNGFLLHTDFQKGFDNCEYSFLSVDTEDGSVDYIFFPFTARYLRSAYVGKALRKPVGQKTDGTPMAEVFPPRVLFDHHFKASVFRRCRGGGSLDEMPKDNDDEVSEVAGSTETLEEVEGGVHETGKDYLGEDPGAWWRENHLRMQSSNV
ncbi:hypothetical protein HK097_001434 [Rhizophlyctis rosea]|uniref:HNH nuclease domain-containing protein n=1 Tax=Rhizophlyctis rosea TaxID=64517 RepID=A0AAD5S4G8_9FUNG|nr:hypothetical protein HK097_001434 [Rhizophlyctis rosea]